MASEWIIPNRKVPSSLMAQYDIVAEAAMKYGGVIFGSYVRESIWNRIHEEGTDHYLEIAAKDIDVYFRSEEQFNSFYECFLTWCKKARVFVEMKGKTSKYLKLPDVKSYTIKSPDFFFVDVVICPTVEPPFGGIDFLCNGFVMRTHEKGKYLTQNGHRYMIEFSKSTGLPSDSDELLYRAMTSRAYTQFYRRETLECHHYTSKEGKTRKEVLVRHPDIGRYIKVRNSGWKISGLVSNMIEDCWNILRVDQIFRLNDLLERHHPEMKGLSIEAKIEALRFAPGSEIVEVAEKHFSGEGESVVIEPFVDERKLTAEDFDYIDTVIVYKQK
jgi:hypothetical protein